MSKPDRIAKALVDASLELYRRRSWDGVVSDAPILIDVPTEDHPVACVLVGQDRDNYGVVMARGEDPIGRLYCNIMSSSTDERSVNACNYAAINIQRLGSIPPELREILKLAGFQTRQENMAPYIFVKPPHRQARGPNKHDRKTFLWCLRALFAVEDRGELHPVLLDNGGQVLRLTASGNLKAPDVQVSWERWNLDENRDLLSPTLLPEDLAKLSRTGGSWCLGLFPLPGGIRGDDQVYQGLLVIDEESEEMFDTGIVPSGDSQALELALIEILRKHGLPNEIKFGSTTLSTAFAPGLTAIGISTSLDKAHLLLRDVREKLSSFFEQSAPTEPLSSPPVTLLDWKQVDNKFIEQASLDLTESNALTPRAMKRYFGSEQVGKQVLGELERLCPIMAFFDWLMADYRVTKRSKTWIEKRAAKSNLDPTERAWLESRCASVLSIFRVVSTTPGFSLELEDILEGNTYTVQDQSLSSSGVEGLFLPLRLHRVGDWWFPSIAGPPLKHLQIDQALRSLEDQGLALSRDGLLREPQLIGSLWGWFLDREESPIILQNTDGDPLLEHRAEYLIANPSRFVKALENRPEVQTDEAGSLWTWVRENPSVGFSDGGLALAHLDLFDDTLLAEVNSKERFAAFQTWIRTFSGVTFKGFQLSPFTDEAPLDDRLPGPPEAPILDDQIQLIEAFLKNHARDWLDQSIPALGGITPRAACSTPKGKRQVARLIRTMPPAMYPGGQIEPPRELLLRELGL